MQADWLHVMLQLPRTESSCHGARIRLVLVPFCRDFGSALQLLRRPRFNHEAPKAFAIKVQDVRGAVGAQPARDLRRHVKMAGANTVGASPAPLPVLGQCDETPLRIGNLRALEMGV